MKKQEHNTTKTSFLTKFKNTKIGFKIIIIGGILALVTTTIVVPIVLTNKGDSSNPKPNVDNRENDNNEDDNKQDDNKQDDNKQDDNKQDDNKQDDNNVDDNQQEKTDSYVQWHAAYSNDNSTTNFDNATPSEYDYINDQISITEGTHFGNQTFIVQGRFFYIAFNQMSKIGINKDGVLKNKDNDKIVGTFIKFLGYDFGTSKTFVNVFYHLKEDSTKWYYETVEITGFGAPKILPTNDASIASFEFHGMVLPKDFIVSSDLSTIGNYAFRYASFTKDAKFSLAQTQVKSIPQFAFHNAKLPNGFALNSETNSIGSDAFSYATFDQDAKFSLAQTQVTSIGNDAFTNTKLPNGFVLNSETNSIGKYAFYLTKFDKEAKFSLAQTKVISINIQAFTLAKLPNAFALNPATTSIALEAFANAHLNPGFKIPDTVTSIAQDAFKDAILPPGYAWYDKDDNKQTTTNAANYPKAGWYVGKI